MNMHTFSERKQLKARVLRRKINALVVIFNCLGNRQSVHAVYTNVTFLKFNRRVEAVNWKS